MNCKPLLILIVFFIIVSETQAQKLGGIQGKIIDKTTKQLLVGANVMVVENDGSTTDLGASTNENGEYFIAGIEENVYKLRISYIGYNTHLEPDIRVIRDKTFYVKEIELMELPIESKDVIVSSGYLIDEKDMPVSNYNYSQEEIVRAPGAMGDIFRAVESLPGVSSGSGEFSAFSVRGDTPQDNIILIDNIPFSDVSHFSETGGDLEVQGGRFSIFTQGMIDKAEFQSGGFSSKYGGKRASLLKLNIKEGNKISPTVKGSYDLTGWEINYDGPTFIEPNTSALFTVRKIDFGTILKLIDDEGDGNSKFSDFILKISSDINKSNKISFLGIYSDEHHLREPYHYFKGNDNSELELSDQKEEKNLAGLNWRLLTGIKGFLNTSLYYNRIKQNQIDGQIYIDPIYDRKLKESEIGTRFPVHIYDVNEKQYGLKTDFTYSFSSKLTINSGFEIKKTDVHNKSFINGSDTLYVFKSENIDDDKKFIVISPNEFNSDIKKIRTEYSCYAEAEFSPNVLFNINGGIRYEHNDWNKMNYLSPRLSGSYKLNDFSSINFAAGIYYQPPRIREISFDRRNLNLKNEKSFHFILGISRYFNNDLKLNIEGYYKKLEDLIFESNSGSNYAENSGKGYSYGADISLIKKFVDKIYGQINYSYSHSKIKKNDKLSYRSSDFNQPHMFNILFGYQLNDNWSFSIKWKYAAGKPKNEFLIHSDVLNDVNRMRYSKEIISENTKRYSDFHSLNLRVDYRKQFTSFLALNVYVDIMNSYDRANEVYEIFEPVSGKNRFSSMGIVPTFGFKIEI